MSKCGSSSKGSLVVLLSAYTVFSATVLAQPPSDRIPNAHDSGVVHQAFGELSQQLDLVDQAINTGHFEQAEVWITPLTKMLPKPGAGFVARHHVLPELVEARIVSALANLYWVTDRIPDLERTVLGYMNGRVAKTWLCRINERTQAYQRAAQCWSGLGESERAARALRELAIQSIFANGEQTGGSSPVRRIDAVPYSADLGLDKHNSSHW